MLMEWVLTCRQGWKVEEVLALAQFSVVLLVNDMLQERCLEDASHDRSTVVIVFLELLQVVDE